MGRRGIPSGRGFAVVVAVVAGLTLAACSPTGEGVAASRADSLADQLGDKLARSADDSRDADWRAATWIRELFAHLPEDPNVSVEALRWTGNTSDEAGALIEVRIRVNVPTHDATSVGANSYQAGLAIKCYQYVVVGPHLSVPVSRRGMSCPDGPAPASPSPTALPALPIDAHDLLTAALRSATPGTVDEVVRAAFPQDFITVDTTATTQEIIAAVGVPRNDHQCIIATRTADGIVSFLAFDRLWVQPGEGGCSVRIVTNPPQ